MSKEISDLVSEFKVRNLMSSEVNTLEPGDRLRLWDEDAKWKKFRHLPVVDKNGKLLGMVSHRDVMNKMARAVLHPEKMADMGEYQAMLAEKVMHKDIETIGPDETIREAAQKMYQNQFGALPVVDHENTLLGILTEADFVELVHFGKDCFE